ncbi:T9SS type A sorting domain-containing protein [Flavobacterium sp.]|uniref:T9SS type A sorting domain-containing protein n=1 Tax=Flavobacterium sp. TaxID=239 RepID=UPI003C4EC443
MKKIYLSIALLAITATSFGQRINIWTDGALGNNNWLNSGNWSQGALLATDIAQMNKTSTINGSRSILKITTEATSDATSEIIQSGTYVATVTVTDNGTNPFEGTAVGIYHNTNAYSASTFNINCKVTCTNTGTGNWFSIRNLNAGNTLKFGSNSALTFSTPDVFLDNAGIGTIGATGGTTTYEGTINSTVSSTLSFSGANGVHTFLPGVSFGANITNLKFFFGAGMTWNFNTADNVVIFDKTIQTNNAVAYALNVNAKNCLAAKLDLSSGSLLTVNVNKDLENMKTVALAGASTGLTLTIDDAVTKLHFANSSAETWAGSITVNGFKPGVIRFGTNNTGLTTAQLNKISGAGGTVALDSSGYLVLASALSNKDFNSFTSSIYPNPVKDVLNINTQESIQKIEVLDILGKTVLTNKGENTVDVSSLNNGIYFLKLTSDKGVSTNKFVKK